LLNYVSQAVVAGAFAIGYVSSVAPTIQANEALFRAGVAAHLIVILTNPPLTLIFFELFKVVNRRLALLAAFFALVATGIEGASLFVQVEHPIVAAYGIYSAFFGFELMTTGYLVYKSNFLPRAIGVLLGSTAPAISPTASSTSSPRASPAISSPGSRFQSWPAKDR
jgi:uncharacterized protein DUF4386